MKREEVVTLLTRPCAFYRSYALNEESGHCKLGNGQTRCSGDFNHCANLEALRKYFRVRGLGWQKMK